MLQIVRKKLSANEITPPNTRYNPECDCVETTYDGGATWTATPGADPRSADAFRAPANATADPQCNAAANMVSRLRFMVDTDLASASIAGVASGLLAGVLLFMPAVGIVVDAILIAVGLILSIGAGAIEAAFDEDVYDGMLCIFDCNIDANGQMSDAQLADIYTAVAAQFDSIVQAVFGAHSSTLGAVGWSNAGALGEITDADCSDCDCGPWCQEWDETEIYAVGGTWTIDHFLTTHAGTTADAGFVTTITHAEFDYSVSGFGAFVDGNAQIYDQDFPGSVLIEDAATDPTGTLIYDNPLGVDVSAFGQAISSQFASGSNYPVITRIRLEGSSGRPSFANGTDCS